MEILQGVWKQHLRPYAVVGYGVKILLPSPTNYVTRSPWWLVIKAKRLKITYFSEFNKFLHLFEVNLHVNRMMPSVFKLVYCYTKCKLRCQQRLTQW